MVHFFTDSTRKANHYLFECAPVEICAGDQGDASLDITPPLGNTKYRYDDLVPPPDDGTRLLVTFLLQLRRL